MKNLEQRDPVFTHGLTTYNRKNIRTTIIHDQLYLVAMDCCKALGQNTAWGRSRYKTLLNLLEREVVFRVDMPDIIEWRSFEEVLTLITLKGFEKLKLASGEHILMPKQEHRLDKDSTLNTNEDLLLSIKDLIDKYTPSRLLIPSEYSTEG